MRRTGAACRAFALQRHRIELGFEIGSRAPARRRRPPACRSTPALIAAAEVAIDPGRRLLPAAVALEAVEIEPEVPDPLPEMRIVDVGAVGEQRVPEPPEAVLGLHRHGLGGRMEGRRARPLARDREVADADPQRQRARSAARCRRSAGRRGRGRRSRAGPIRGRGRRARAAGRRRSPARRSRPCPGSVPVERVEDQVRAGDLERRRGRVGPADGAVGSTRTSERFECPQSAR